MFAQPHVSNAALAAEFAECREYIAKPLAFVIHLDIPASLAAEKTCGVRFSGDACGSARCRVKVAEYTYTALGAKLGALGKDEHPARRAVRGNAELAHLTRIRNACKFTARKICKIFTAKGAARGKLGRFYVYGKVFFVYYLNVHGASSFAVTFDMQIIARRLRRTQCKSYGKTAAYMQKQLIFPASAVII